MAKVVTVFGLSGVGKSWMISRYAAAANVAHIQASKLIRDAIAGLDVRPVTSEDLRRGPILDNQSILTDAFAKVHVAEARPIIFDGHCLVDVGEQPIEIPVDVIRQVQPSGVVLVHASADEIVRRRKSDTSRERPVRSADALATQQDRCVAICTDYAEQLGIGFGQVRAGDERGFAQSISEYDAFDAVANGCACGKYRKQHYSTSVTGDLTRCRSADSWMAGEADGGPFSVVAYLNNAATFSQAKPKGGLRPASFKPGVSGNPRSRLKSLHTIGARTITG